MTYQTISTFTAALVLLLGTAATAGAQDAALDPRTSSVPTMLARYEREVSAPPLYQSETEGTLLAILSGLEGRYPATRVDSVLSGLERIARGGGDPEVRAAAVGLIAVAGDVSAVSPHTEVTALLTRIHRDDGEGALRAAVVAAMPGQSNRGLALAFLRRVAEQPGAADAFPQESVEAARALGAMGSQGRAVLRDVHARRTARNPETAHWIEFFGRRP
jgi:hypothetical protein